MCGMHFKKFRKIEWAVTQTPVFSFKNTVTVHLGETGLSYAVKVEALLCRISRKLLDRCCSPTNLHYAKLNMLKTPHCYFTLKCDHRRMCPCRA